MDSEFIQFSFETRLVKMIEYLLFSCVLVFAVSAEQPYVTPEKLLGGRFPKNTFEGITVAVVGYCPPAAVLKKYNPAQAVGQPFILLPPECVQICSYKGQRFLSISHVYGGPVSAALLEELAYYGIKHVLAYGLCGSLATKPLKIGDYFMVTGARVSDGTTLHYTPCGNVTPSEELMKRLRFPGMTPVIAWTTDAIYREYPQDVRRAIVEGCDIVNCDSSHLFAVGKKVGIATVQCGVVSDVLSDEVWEDGLGEMLNPEDSGSTLRRLDPLVEYYVEQLLQELSEFPEIGR